MAISGVGAKLLWFDPPLRRLKITTPSDSWWNEIAEINSISGPSFSKEQIDVTTLSDDDGFRKFIGSFRDGGEVTLTTNFTRNDYRRWFAAFNSDDFGTEEELFYFAISIADAPLNAAGSNIAKKLKNRSTLLFSGIVLSAPWDIPMGDKITTEIRIKVSGRPVFGTDRLTADPAGIITAAGTITLSSTLGDITVGASAAAGTSLPTVAAADFPVTFDVVSIANGGRVPNLNVALDGKAATFPVIVNDSTDAVSLWNAADKKIAQTPAALIVEELDSGERVELPFTVKPSA